MSGSVTAEAGPLPPRVEPDHGVAVGRVRAVIAAGPFDATWSSLQEVGTPGRYQGARFELVLHSGVDSSLPSAKSAPNVRLEGSAEFEHHVATHGP